MTPAQINRIAAALDYLHDEFDLSAEPRVEAWQWIEAFKAAGQAPNFDAAGISDALLYREPLMEAATEQAAQLTEGQWLPLGL